MKVAFYVTATGEIDYIFAYPPEANIPADIVADLETGYSWMEIPPAQLATVALETHYVSAGNFVLRPTVFLSESVTIGVGAGASAENKLEFAVPAGTKIYSHYHNTEYELGAENFTFQTMRPGEWIFDVEPPFPHRSTTIEVTANAD